MLCKYLVFRQWRTLEIISNPKVKKRVRFCRQFYIQSLLNLGSYWPFLETHGSSTKPSGMCVFREINSAFRWSRSWGPTIRWMYQYGWKFWGRTMRQRTGLFSILVESVFWHSCSFRLTWSRWRGLFFEISLDPCSIHITINTKNYEPKL